jgi:hypothetical protein
MVTLTRFQEELQDLLRVTARQAGRDSGFVQRERKLSGESFVQTLVWGWLANPEASLEELSQTAALCGVVISAQGLAQRMSERAAACLREVLEASMALVAQGGKGSSTFLQRFRGVYLLDSSIVPLPLVWHDLWPGSGNQYQQQAALKLQTVWDYQNGGLHISLHAGRDNDAALPVPCLPSGAVRVMDSAYFDVVDLQAVAQQDQYYVVRVPSQVRVVEESNQRACLSAFLQRQAHPDFDGWVTLTGRKLHCRLIAQRVPEAVATQRRARIRQRCQRKRQPVSQEALALAGWTIIVTNLPQELLSTAEAIFLLRLRWQIELLFKLFKQHSHLCASRSHNPERILCEIYAKLLGLVLQHALLLATCWDLPHRSLVKLAQTVRKSTFLIAHALWSAPSHFVAVLTALTAVFRAGCRLNKRKAQPSHFQRLLSLS